MSYELKTKKGYDFFECSSAFQKAIRRGEEDTAMYFAVELFNSNYGEYLWKRIKIITSEDVGLAHPSMPATIQALYQMYLDQAKKKDEKHFPERLFLTQAVITLCRAKKSRLVDWTLLAYWNSHDHRRLDIPNYAYDKHNATGRKMGRGKEHFYEEGSVLSNHEPQDLEAERRDLAYKFDGAKQTLFD